MYEFWEERYREEGYAYGEEPNVFFKRFIDSRGPGKILLPGEGEGRNAVYAAKAGWQVDAYDFSEKAIENATEFARKQAVNVNFIHCSHSDLGRFDADYDAVALIYAHVPNDSRQSFHRQLVALLKPGGEFVLEAFTTEQINNSSGGPKSVDMLYQLNDVMEDFSESCEFEIIEAIEEELSEGKYHVGKANFIRMLAQKK